MMRRRFGSGRSRNEDGIAIVVAMTAVFVVLSITAIAITNTLGDLASSRRNAARAEARAGAERTVDNIAALIEQSDGLLALRSRIAARNGAGMDGWWGAALTATVNGRRVAATDAAGANDVECRRADGGADVSYSPDEAWNTCAKTKVVALTTTGENKVITDSFFDSSSNRESVTEITIETITRSKCLIRSGAVDAATCAYTRQQQRLRARTYFDKLILSDSSAVAPNAYAPADPLAGSAAAKCGTAKDPNYGLRAKPSDDTDNPAPVKRDPACLTGAYHADQRGGDSLQGAVHTNDDKTTVCAAGGSRVDFGSNKPSNRGNTTFGATARCGTGDIGPDAANAANRATRLAIPDTNSPLMDLAKSSGTKFTAPLTKVLLLAGKEMVVDDGSGGPATTRQLPESGVVWSSGDIAIAGTLSGRLTVRARGTIYITGDLTYADKGRDLLGLIADEDVVFTCNDVPDRTPTADPCPAKRTVHAAIVATGFGRGEAQATDGPYGGIYNRDWFNGAKSDEATLEFFGSMASRYRPVFGSFQKWSPYELVNGWYKDFDYDERLLRDQPPYMLRPANRGWDRLDLSELPCRSGSGPSAVNVCTTA